MKVGFVEALNAPQIVVVFDGALLDAIVVFENGKVSLLVCDHAVMILRLFHILWEDNFANMDAVKLFLRSLVSIFFVLWLVILLVIFILLFNDLLQQLAVSG